MTKLFARFLQDQTGATAIEAWISIDGLKAVPAYRHRAACGRGYPLASER